MFGIRADVAVANGHQVAVISARRVPDNVVLVEGVGEPVVCETDRGDCKSDAQMGKEEPIA